MGGVCQPVFPNIFRKKPPGENLTPRRFQNGSFFVVFLQLQDLVDVTVQEITDLRKSVQIDADDFVLAVVIQLCALEPAGVAKLRLADPLFLQNPFYVDSNPTHYV